MKCKCGEQLCEESDRMCNKCYEIWIEANSNITKQDTKDNDNGKRDETREETE